MRTTYVKPVKAARYEAYAPHAVQLQIKRHALLGAVAACCRMLGPSRSGPGVIFHFFTSLLSMHRMAPCTCATMSTVAVTRPRSHILEYSNTAPLDSTPAAAVCTWQLRPLQACRRTAPLGQFVSLDLPITAYDLFCLCRGEKS